jgi:hypothetical protein
MVDKIAARRVMTDEVPDYAVRAAARALETYRPGSTVLELQAETLSTLCFSDDDVIADVILTRYDGTVDLQADVRDRALTSIALDVVAPDGEVTRVASTSTFPACFADVRPGLFSLVITLAEAGEPERVTAWSRLGR